jgi:glycerol kinase
VYGPTKTTVFASKIPLAGIAGDQHAALFGQMCTRSGMVKNTYGTGCFLVMNTGTKPIESSNNLVTTIAWQIGDQVNYALEGSIFIAGAVVQWLRDGLGIIRSASEIEALARGVEHCDGVYLVPAFAGLGAPHWNARARGTLFGVTRGTTSAHIARAALDSIAYQSVDVLKAMEADSGIHIDELRVDGGACANNLLMQFQADILGVDAVRPQISETTALGAAYLAGLATGYWKDIDELQSQWKLEHRFSPSMPGDQAKACLDGWQRAIRAAKAWADAP